MATNTNKNARAIFIVSPGTRLTSPRAFVNTRLVKLAQDRHLRLAIFIGTLAIAVRFIAINQPFVDEWSWRQSDVAAIARNYFTGGFHFARPQIDWAGKQPGYVGTEFPILPFGAALAYKIFGVHEWIGRGESVLLFAASLPFFFLFVRQIFGPNAAFCALFFYSFAPLCVMTSRCFMPDVPSLSLSIIGLYLFQRWITVSSAGAKPDGFKPSSFAMSSSLFWSSALCISLSILLKAPSAIIGAPLAIAAVYDRRHFSRLVVFALIALVPAAIWYTHAYQIAQTFYPHHMFGAGGFRVENLDWYLATLKRVFLSSLTPILFLLGIAGAITARSTRKAGVLYAWLAAMILFVIVVGYGNRHPWYQLPLVPIFAAFAGEFCARKLSPRTFALVVIATLACAIIPIRNLYRESAAELRLAGLELKRTTPPNSLIVAPDYGDPTIFYYAERRGWHFLERNATYYGHPTTDADAIVDLAQLRQRGATHIVFYSKTFWWLELYKDFARYLEEHATLVESNPQFRIYQLK
jgi:4-amino-4-deoxy-L-arabinose transferase-like glycosyltransferase